MGQAKIRNVKINSTLESFRKLGDPTISLDDAKAICVDLGSTFLEDIFNSIQIDNPWSSTAYKKSFFHNEPAIQLGFRNYFRNLTHQGVIGFDDANYNIISLVCSVSCNTPTVIGEVFDCSEVESFISNELGIDPSLIKVTHNPLYGGTHLINPPCILGVGYDANILFNETNREHLHSFTPPELEKQVTPISIILPFTVYIKDSPNIPFYDEPTNVSSSFTASCSIQQSDLSVHSVNVTPLYFINTWDALEFKNFFKSSAELKEKLQSWCEQLNLSYNDVLASFDILTPDNFDDEEIDEPLVFFSFTSLKDESVNLPFDEAIYQGDDALLFINYMINQLKEMDLTSVKLVFDETLLP